MMRRAVPDTNDNIPPPDPDVGGDAVPDAGQPYAGDTQPYNPNLDSQEESAEVPATTIPSQDSNEGVQVVPDIDQQPHNCTCTGESSS